MSSRGAFGDEGSRVHPRVCPRDFSPSAQQHVFASFHYALNDKNKGDSLVNKLIKI